MWCYSEDEGLMPRDLHMLAITPLHRNTVLRTPLFHGTNRCDGGIDPVEHESSTTYITTCLLHMHKMPNEVKGDSLPPINGKLRIYNMRFCPYAQRTILALNAKQIDYEVININLMDKPEWLTSKSQFGKVPALETEDGVSLYESLVTVEYLDEIYPQRPLLPKDPVQRAFDKIIVEAAGPLYTLFFKLLKSPETITDENVRAFHRSLDFIQEQLKQRGTKFLDGSEPGYADYMIWPWFERLLELKTTDERANIDSVKYKLLVEYFNNMLEDPAVSQYLVPRDIFLRISDSYRQGKHPEYDLLLEA